MQIKTVKVGSLQTNCYVVIDEKSREAMVIDPGAEAEKILPEIKNLKVRSIIITHGHPDHFGAVDELKKETGAPILMSPEDAWFFKPDKEIKDGDEIKVGELTFSVLKTPGHSSGSVCLYIPGHLFAGDTLFREGCGRTDLPGSSTQQMRQSLKRLSNLPPDTVVYPGHDEFTTIKNEKERGTLG